MALAGSNEGKERALAWNLRTYVGPNIHQVHLLVLQPLLLHTATRTPPGITLVSAVREAR